MIILFFSHILSDYYLQGDKTAHLKGKQIRYMLLHVLPILLTNVIVLFIFYGKQSIKVALYLTLSHLLVDIISSGLFNIRFSKNKFLNHSIDQLLHVGFLVIYYLFFLIEYNYAYWIQNFLQINSFTVYGIQYLTVITACMFLLKPMRIFIDDLLEVTVGQLENEVELKKSYYLGYVERLITFVTVATFSYIFITAIIAFKTWAQSEKLSKNVNDFSKRYLIGTLASMFSAIVTAILVVWYFQKIGFPLVKIE